MEPSPLLGQAVAWLRDRRRPVVRYGIGALVALIAAGVTWFVPSLHDRAQRVWAKALPPAPETYDSSAPAAQADSLADAVDGLKEQVAGLEKRGGSSSESGCEHTGSVNQRVGSRCA